MPLVPSLRSFGELPLGLAAFLLFGLASSPRVHADDHGKLLEQLPERSTNAAIYYQRAVLFLQAIDPDRRQILKKPLWEIVASVEGEQKRQEMRTLLFEARNAIRSASTGARLRRADFAIDVQRYAVAPLLPHVEPMLELSRIVSLHGMQLEARGEWEQAARAHFETIRMGRHMAHQLTLAETLVGVEMLESSYYALSGWAVRCPDVALARRAFRQLAILSDDLVAPGRTLAAERAIFRYKFDLLRQAFPDGPWAETVLEAVDEPIPEGGDAEVRKKAIEVCVARGIPEETFHDKEAFERHLGKLESLRLRLADETAFCMTLPHPAAVERGQKISAKYAEPLRKVGDPRILNPGAIAAYLAIHDAELILAKLVLALAAHRSDEGFPTRLADVAAVFGGKLPISPYDGSPIVYQTQDQGQGFSIHVAEAKIGEIVLSKVDFQHAVAADVSR